MCEECHGQSVSYIESGAERKSVPRRSRCGRSDDAARHGQTRPACCCCAWWLPSAWTWGLAHSPAPQAVYPWMIGGLIGGMVTAFVTIFKKTWAPLAAPLYALLEGLVLGGISAVFEKAYPGIAVQAVGLTFGTLFVLLLAYKSGVIRATQRFKTGVIAATGGIAVFYLVAMLLSFFHVSVGILYSSSPWGIAFSVFVVIVAALNLVIDFEHAERDDP